MGMIEHMKKNVNYEAKINRVMNSVQNFKENTNQKKFNVNAVENDFMFPARMMNKSRFPLKNESRQTDEKIKKRRKR